MPLSLPSLATIALFYAVSRWNGYADVRYYINSSQYYTLQMKLYQVVFASSSAAAFSSAALSCPARGFT